LGGGKTAKTVVKKRTKAHTRMFCLVRERGSETKVKPRRSDMSQRKRE